MAIPQKKVYVPSRDTLRLFYPFNCIIFEQLTVFAQLSWMCCHVTKVWGFINIRARGGVQLYIKGWLMATQIIYKYTSRSIQLHLFCIAQIHKLKI